jgi:hypothetical protein
LSYGRCALQAWEADYRAKKTSLDLSPPSVSPTNAKELNIDDIDDVGILAQQMCLLGMQSVAHTHARLRPC